MMQHHNGRTSFTRTKRSGRTKFHGTKYNTRKQVHIQREIKIILQEINILKERFRNVESRVKEICENPRNVPHHLRRQDRVQPLPEL